MSGLTIATGEDFADLPWWAVLRRGLSFSTARRTVGQSSLGLRVPIVLTHSTL
jgi:hypothetical protein